MVSQRAARPGAVRRHPRPSIHPCSLMDVFLTGDSLYFLSQSVLRDNRRVSLYLILMPQINKSRKQPAETNSKALCFFKTPHLLII